jgi:hypothetical protein
VVAVNALDAHKAGHSTALTRLCAVHVEELVVALVEWLKTKAWGPEMVGTGGSAS